MKSLLAALPFGLFALFPASVLPLPQIRPATRALPPDSTTVRLLHGAASADLTEQLMSRVLGIEKHRLELHDRRLAGRHLRLTLQEYRRGVPGPEQEFTKNTNLTQLDSAGRLAITIYARPVSATQVENLFILPRVGVATPKTFATLSGPAEKYPTYSLRFGVHALRRSLDQTGTTPRNPAQDFRLPVGPTAILAVYTLPYEKDGFGYYCGLAESRVPVAEWYGRFRVPHFVVYRVRVE